MSNLKIAYIFMAAFAVAITELQENTEALKTKMSELRLYCDLLLQQVNKIKENDELGDAAEVRRRFGGASEIREVAVDGKTLQQVISLCC